jgi:hypothetical protein
VPLVAPPTQALSVVSVPLGTTVSELPYRDVAAAGISPFGPTELPHPAGFKPVTYKKKTTTSTSLAGIAAVNKVKRRQTLIGVCISLSLPVITKLKDMRHNLSLGYC